VTKDGSPYASGAAAGLSFTPNDNGAYVVSLTATDDDGGMGTAPTVTITVANVAPAVVINGAPSIGSVGSTITLTNTVTDPGSLDTFTYAWSVTKDGNPFASGTSASFSFTPDAVGAYEVTLVVTDKDGDTANAMVTISAQYRVLLPLIMRFSP
jgi:PKD repeat protein